ncbi:MAG: arginine--tRNA ligase [Methylacidiphilales bacterium]|nr:arginine--tRNA ligase [Candidatus Methylacidiphilales bacterium]MDW8350073.1 arginine--tRNA ligase [Verrucomicrobiae bacterium]
MISPRHHLTQWLTQALPTLHLHHLPPTPIQPCPHPAHGDYQTNLALTHAKTLSTTPTSLAHTLIQALPPHPLFETPQIAGPGFINFRLTPHGILHLLNTHHHDPRLGIPTTPHPRHIIIDFSSPNVAKEMHIGHIRSTLLGDVLARILTFTGHRVTRINHLGDWGTQFGKILLAYKRYGSPLALEQNPIPHLESLYQRITQEEKTDPTTAQAARDELVRLQRGDPENLALWKTFCQHTLRTLFPLYDRLDIHFHFILGESFYHPWLHDTVQDLLSLGIARPSQGAIAIFFDDDPDLRHTPMLIQKTDEGYLYATTDLAALRYRILTLHADEILYVTDGRQQRHFRQLFAVARRWLPSHPVTLRHIWFGTILGPDKKPLKTREGTPIKLRDLLDEAETRALSLIRQKRPDLPPDQHTHIARTIGISALKYADLAQNRNLDYIFDWDRLLALDGNTAPYLLNAYVRIASIFRKAHLTPQRTPIPTLQHPLEIALAKKILAYADALDDTLHDYRPHLLCTYLYELATLFHQYYEHCPILKTEGDTRTTRLSLCAWTRDTLAHGLSLLGIPTLEEM